jgi:hypothetical protein
MLGSFVVGGARQPERASRAPGGGRGAGRVPGGGCIRPTARPPRRAKPNPFRPPASACLPAPRSCACCSSDWRNWAPKNRKHSTKNGRTGDGAPSLATPGPGADPAAHRSSSTGGAAARAARPARPAAPRLLQRQQAPRAAPRRRAGGGRSSRAAGQRPRWSGGGRGPAADRRSGAPPAGGPPRLRAFPGGPAAAASPRSLPLNFEAAGAARAGARAAPARGAAPHARPRPRLEPPHTFERPRPRPTRAAWWRSF